VALLGAAGLVMVVFGLAAYYATDELSGFSIANLAFGAVALVAAAIAQGRRITGFRGELPRRMAFRWLVILSAVTAGVIVANALAADWRAFVDLTSLGRGTRGLYELSPQTRDVLRKIDEDEGEAPTVFVLTDSHLAPEVSPLVDSYRAASERLEVVRLRTGDVPPHVRPYLDYDPTLLPCSQTRCEPVGYPTEGNLTTALLRLLGPERLRAYFLLGHGELDLADESDDGYSLVRETLLREGIEPRGWIGPARETVPSDADLVIIGAPERDLLRGEIDALQRYLADGGRLLALLEPGQRTNLDDLLERWGFGLPPGVVADQATSPLLEEPRVVSLVVNSFSPDHPVVRRFSARTMLLMPTVRPVSAVRKPEPNDQLHELVFSSRYGWIEQDVEAALRGREVSPDPDEPGGRELPIAVAGRYPRGGTETRIVVVGDRDFTSNIYLHALFNRDLLMNAIHWLADRTAGITIRDKAWTPRQDPLTMHETLSFFYFFAFALPEALLLLGIIAWYRQRS
jgi:hypothetical protein